MTHEELAWQFVEVFDDLPVDQINEMLAKNVPLETLSFFADYAGEFAKSEGLAGRSADRLPNLLLIGYLIRVLEQRLEPGADSDDD